MVAPEMSDAVLGYAAETQTSAAAKPLRVRFVKDVFVFGWANILCLVLNGSLTFILPRYLAIEDFGYYRLFVLYSSLAGILHAGLIDGLLVRWAEKPGERIGPEIRPALRFLLWQHIAVLVPAIVVLLAFVHNPYYLWVGLGLAVYVVIVNGSTLAQVALMSRKEFRELSAFTVLTAVLLLVLVLLWKVLDRLDSLTAIVSYIAANLIAAFGMWRVALRPGAAPARPLARVKQLGSDNIRLGWKILIANLLLSVTPALDRFFVSGTFSIQEFAIYAFAGNALAVVYTVAMSAARVVYPYLNEATTPTARRKAYDLGQATVLALWALSLTLYFPTAYLVHWIVPKYASSLPIVRLLMINSAFVTMIHILHANYFRVHLALNRFLGASVIGVGSAALLLAIARRSGDLLWMAAAMTFAVTIWWVANELLLGSELGASWVVRGRIFFVWVASSAAFLAACTLARVWLGGIVFAAVCTVVVVFGLKSLLAPLFTRCVPAAP